MQKQLITAVEVVKKLSLKTIVVLMIFLLIIANISSTPSLVLKQGLNTPFSITANATTGADPTKSQGAAENTGKIVPEDRKDAISPGKKDKENVMQGIDENSHAGAESVLGPSNIVVMLLNGFVMFIFYIPVIIEFVLTTFILNAPNEKLQEAYDKGKEKAGENDKKVYDVAKYLSDIEKIVFGDFKQLDPNIFAADKSDLTKERYKSDAATLKLNTILAIGVSFVVFLLAVIVLIYKSLTDATAFDMAKIKQLLADIFVGAAIALMIPFVLAFLFYIVQLLLGLINNIRYSFIANGNLSFESYTLTKIIAGQSSSVTGWLGDIIVFLCMVVLQAKILYLYANRLVTLMFLTTISPLIAITYAIDKAIDNKSQILSKFFSIFISELVIILVYPVIYLMFIYTFSPLAIQAPLFGALVLYMFPSIEKIVKSMFGIDKENSIQTTDKIATGFKIL